MSGTYPVMEYAKSIDELLEKHPAPFEAFRYADMGERNLLLMTVGASVAAAALEDKIDQLGWEEQVAAIAVVINEFVYRASSVLNDYDNFVAKFCEDHPNDVPPLPELVVQSIYQLCREEVTRTGLGIPGVKDES